MSEEAELEKDPIVKNEIFITAEKARVLMKYKELDSKHFLHKK